MDLWFRTKVSKKKKFNILFYFVSALADICLFLIISDMELHSFNNKDQVNLFSLVTH